VSTSPTLSQLAVPVVVVATVVAATTLATVVVEVVATTAEDKVDTQLADKGVTTLVTVADKVVVAMVVGTEAVPHPKVELKDTAGVTLEELPVVVATEVGVPQLKVTVDTRVEARVTKALFNVVAEFV